MTGSAAADRTFPAPSSRLREALGLSIPIIVSQLLMTVGAFISNLMLSKVDEVTFASGLLTGSVQLVVITVVFGVLFSMSALIGRVVGERERPERIGLLLVGGSGVALLSSVPVMVVLYNIKPLLLVFGQPPATAELCEVYFRIFLWAVPTTGIICAYIQFLLGTFQQAVVLAYSVCSLVVSTLLAYVLIFGKLGAPPLGIEGLAWASLVTSWAGFIALTLLILNRAGNHVFALMNVSRAALLQPMRQIVKLGLPISVQMGNEIGSFMVTTLMVGWLGIEALQMQQVATRYLMLLVIPIVGLSQAVMIVVSRQLGAGNAEELRRNGKFYLLLGFGYSLVVLAAFALFPRALTEVFLSYTPATAAMFKIIAILLIVVAIGQLFDSIRNIATGALRGLQDVRFPMHLSIVLIWLVGLPLAYYMGFVLKQGLIGIAVAHNIVMVIGGAVLLVRWRSKTRALLTSFAVCLFCLQSFIEPAAAGESSTPWRAYAADAAATKYLPLKQINARNVALLRESWVWTSPDDALVDQFNSSGLKLWPHAFESTPLMIDGRLYVSTSLSQIAAIDAVSGTTLWVHDTQSYLAEDGARIAYPPNIGFVERGVAYWERGPVQRLFFATGSAVLVALDARTGQLEREFGDGGRVDLKQGLRSPAPQSFYSVTSPPLVCGNVVVVGSTVLDFPLQPQMPPGDVRAFDVRTGKLLWTFHTIPQDGEPGADTWDAEARAKTGAANVWAPMSCDSKLGIVYLPVSTPANDFYGGNRKGHNLFGDSLVALRAATGKLAWYHQLVHHGLWDYDPPAAPNLVDIHVGGRSIKAVAQVTKQGFVYVFDRVTGKPVWPIVERPVPQSLVPGEHSAATQPIPSKPLAFDRQGISPDDLIDLTPELRSAALETIAPFVHGPLFTPPVLDQSAQGGPRGTLFLPGNLGGGSWTGAAVNPKTGILYVPSVSRPAVVVLSAFSSARYAGATSALRLPDELPIIKPPFGRVTAIDLNSGNHLWMKPVGNGPVDHPAIRHLRLRNLGWDRRSFFIVTDSLLFGVQEGIVTPNAEQPSRLTTLFSVTNDEAFLWALDPKTGEKLLELPIRYGNASGSPMTYEVRGKQFVVVPVGGAGHPARLVAYSLP